MTTITAFPSRDGSHSIASNLSPEDAARNAWAMTPADLSLLSDDARMAVARVRPLKMRSAPRPIVPLLGRVAATLRRTA